MPPTVKGLFQCRVDDFFNSSLTSIGVLPSICDALRKYDLFHYLQFWHRDSSFPTYTQWKSIVKTKIREKENDDWLSYCQDYPGMHVAQACLLNTPPRQFWSLAGQRLPRPCKPPTYTSENHGKFWFQWRGALAFSHARCTLFYLQRKCRKCKPLSPRLHGIQTKF